MCLQWKFDVAELVNYTFLAPARKKTLFNMPFQTLSTKQSEVAEFGIIRLILLNQLEKYATFFMQIQ